MAVFWKVESSSNGSQSLPAALQLLSLSYNLARDTEVKDGDLVFLFYNRGFRTSNIRHINKSPLMPTDGNHVELNQYFQSSDVFSEKEKWLSLQSVPKPAFMLDPTVCPLDHTQSFLNLREIVTRVRDSQATSTSFSSSIGHKPSSLQDLLLDVCNSTKDAQLQPKEYIHELQSVLRRRQGLGSEIRKYIASRKVVKKAIKKALKNLKGIENKCKFSSEDPEIVTMIRMLREVESISLAVFESLLPFISEPKSQAKKSGWSLFSKLIHHQRIAYEEEETNVNEFAVADAALESPLSRKTDKMMNAQKKLSSLELCIEDLENGIEGLYRGMIKTRASFLNIFI
ncbi:hypothetical protein NC652_011787 [Populus alba x Populus x berolinensis]|nr:hypothetical protein NC652_011787 [Populus alba x Populus x berolinensis]